MPTGLAAHGDDGILGALARSQLARVDRSNAVDPSRARARTVPSSFETLARVLELSHPVEPRVIDGETIAEMHTLRAFGRPPQDAVPSCA